MKVFKYGLIFDGKVTCEVEIPRGAKFRHVGLDHDSVVSLWAEVSEDTGKQRWRFHAVGTGREFDRTAVGHYVGTVLLPEVREVWHIHAQRIAS